MSRKSRVPIAVVVSSAFFCMAISTPSFSQVWGDPEAQALSTQADDHERFEAERLRQQQLQLEKERREQEKLRFEIERLRQENERHKQEQLRLENERLRQENELRELENLRLEIEKRDRERAQEAALRGQVDGTDRDAGSDLYDQLRTIVQLRDDGILTEAEFQGIKKKILD